METINSNPEFTTALLDWYRANARKLLWRETKDPYAIWVSEVMLQQTRVETVIPYYERFLRQFPSLTALAAAPEEEVLKAWEGLGYYRRARLLHQGVREVAAQYGGVIPSEPGALAALPGVGPYITGALSSIAFELPLPAVDGNVIRVVSRVLAWTGEVSSADTRRTVTEWVRAHFPVEERGDFTQALMEQGALICVPGVPKCEECAVREFCKAYGHHPENLPVRKDEKAIPAERRIVMLIQRQDRRLLVRRPKKGLMAGFWEYPHLLAGLNDDPRKLIFKWTEGILGATPEFALQQKMVHIYSHLRWDLEIWTAEWRFNQEPKTPVDGGWFTADEEEKLSRVAFVRELGRRE